MTVRPTERGRFWSRSMQVSSGTSKTIATAGTCRRFVCTLKFQGETDYATAARFAAIPGSVLRHLYHNKHELTWIKIW